MPQTSPPRAWAEIDASAIRHNLKILKQASGNAQMMPVVKAGAYGHGLEQVARVLDNEGIAYFGVANVGEARRIAQCGCRTTPYILGPCFAGEREEIVANGWVPFISTIEEGEHYQSLAGQYGKQFKVHLSIDVGMGRGGFVLGELPSVLEKIRGWTHLDFDGVAAHLPSADEDRQATLDQIQLFAQCLQEISGTFAPSFRHLAASAGILDYNIPSANLARPGLALYGISPVDSRRNAELKPALVLKSRITLVRNLPANHGISYGSTYRTEKPSTVATVGFGYADGYPRSLSGKGATLFYKGRRIPLLGRVTMDQVVADVTGIDNPAGGDEVEIFGRNIPVEETARLAGTIPWEILTSIGPRIPRVYL